MGSRDGYFEGATESEGAHEVHLRGERDISELPNKAARYTEVSITQSIPTKTGDEDARNGHSVESRPATAGTTASGDAEVDSHTLRILKEFSTKSQIIGEHVSGSIFFRRNSVEASASQPFQFKPAQTRSMGFDRPRPPHSSFMATQTKTDANEIENGDLSSLKAPLPPVLHSLSANENLQQDNGHLCQNTTAGSSQHALNNRPKKKKRQGSSKKRRRRHGESHRTEQVPLETIPAQGQEQVLVQNTPYDQEAHLLVDKPSPTDFSKVDMVNNEHDTGMEAEAYVNNIANLEYDTAEAMVIIQPINDEPEMQHSQIPKELNACAVGQSENIGVAPVQTHQDPSELVVPQTQGPYEVSAQPVKCNSKRRKRTAIEDPGNYSANPQIHFEPEHYMQMALEKMQERQQTQNIQFQADLELKQSQLEECVRANQELETELVSLQQEKQTLNTTVHEQRVKLTTCVGKMKKLKTFVDGLGRDANALKKEVDVTRQEHDELTDVVGKQLAQKTAAIDQLTECSEKSRRLKNDALVLQKETKAELERFQSQSVLLTATLNEKVAQLAEERARRSQVEATLSLSSQSNAEIIQLMDAHKSWIIEELAKINVSTQKSVQENGDLAGKLFEKLGCLISGQDANNSAMNDLRRLTESLRTSLQVLGPRTDLAGKREHSDILNFQSHVESTLKDLRCTLDEREKFMRQEALHRETIAKLQEQIKVSVKDVNNALQQLSLVEKREAEAREQNEQLQTKISYFEDTTVVNQETTGKMKELEAKLVAKEGFLQLAKSNEALKATEMKRLETANSNLQEDIRNLQEEVKRVTNFEGNFEPQREQLNRQHQEALEVQKAQMMEETNQFAAEERMKYDNELQSLTKQKEKLQKKVDTMSKTFKPDSIHEKRELEQKVKSLEQEVRNARISLKDHAAIKNHNDTMVSQLASTQTEFEKQLADVKQVMQKDHATASSLQFKELSEAREDARRSKAGLQQYQETSKIAAEDEKRKHQKEIDALQFSVSERDQELQRSKEAAENFRAQVERTWNDERQTHLEELGKIRRRAEEAIKAKEEAVKAAEKAMKAKEEAVAEIERFHRECLALKEQQANVRKDDEDVTPSSTSNERQSALLRKPAFGTPDEGMPIPTPKMHFQQRSGTTRAIMQEPKPEDLQVGKLKGAVVDERQLDDIIQPYRNDVRNGHAKDHSDLFSDLEIDKFFADQFAFEPKSSPVMSQSEKTANGPVIGAKESAFSVPSIRNSQSQIRSSFFASSYGADVSVTKERNTSTNLKDSIEGMAPHFTSQSSASKENSQQSLPFSQADDEQYTYKKTYAHPNSSSKLMRRPSDAETGVKRHEGSISESPSFESSYNRRGTTVTLGGVPQSQTIQPSSSHSSSPDFVTASAISVRTRTNSQTFGNSNLLKRHRAKPRASPTVDPRLARRNPKEQQKRKADESTNPLQERESKRQASSMRNDTPQKGSRYPLRVHQTGADVPSLPTVNTTSSSRMRTLAGTVVGGPRRSRKQSKNDNYDAFFSKATSRR